MSVAFLDEGTFERRGESSSPKLWGFAHKSRGGGGGLTDLELFLGGLVKRGEVNISGWGWYPGGHYGKVKLIRTDFCHRWCKLDFELSHGSGELQDKTCKWQVYFSCCLTLLTTAVSHEVKSSYYRCQNFNHQTYYNSTYWNHI